MLSDRYHLAYISELRESDIKRPFNEDFKVSPVKLLN